MKKIFFATTILILGATVTFAQGTSYAKKVKWEDREARKEKRKERRAEIRSEVSIVTINQFATDFPEARNVQYQKNNDYDVVSFTTGEDKQLKAYYDYTGQLQGTIEDKTFSDLPVNAQKKILKQYPGFTVEHVIRYNDNEDNSINTVLYGRPFENDDYFVELKGTDKSIVLSVDEPGYVSLFTTIK